MAMLLISHILIALTSLLTAGLAFFKPTTKRLRISYVLVGLTVASGSVLIVERPAHMVQSCTTGLVYLAVVFAAIIAAHYKLARD